MICTAITESKIDSMVRIANSTDSDLAELRLDYLDDFSEIEKIRNIRKPKISTCMPVWEGGKFKGSEKERIEILLSAIKFSDYSMAKPSKPRNDSTASLSKFRDLRSRTEVSDYSRAKLSKLRHKVSDYITIELRTRKSLRDRLIKKAKETGVKVIISYHDFNSTPERKETLEILKKERAAGADIAKISFMPKNYADVVNTMYTLVGNNLEIPIIAVSMGRLGRISRILAPVFGSYLTYASAGKGKESAEGQLTVKELKAILKILER